MMKEFEGEAGLTLRALVVAILLTIFVSASAAYIAIMISALPWPIILSVIISWTLISLIDKLLKKKHTIHEVNVAQAGGSIGGLIAAGVAFTIPAIWYLKEVYGIAITPPSLFQIILIALAGGILGIALSLPVRRVVIDEENLPFPSGLAGAEVLKAAESGGVSAELVLFSLIFAGIFASIKNVFLPPVIVITVTIFGLIIIFSFIPLLVAIGTGYLIGEKQSFSWFLGAVIGWAILMPFLQVMKFLDFVTPIKNMGMGIVFGAGLAFFFIQALPKSTVIFKEFIRLGKRNIIGYMPILASIFAFVLLLIARINVVVALLGVLGAWMTSAIAGKTTGETNIDPLEQFGLMIGLAISIFFAILGISLDFIQALLITAFVAIASAVAGDIGHDYKSAQVIGTRPIDIALVDLSASIVGSIVAPIAVFVVINAFYNDIFTKASSLAFQSKLVGEALYGFAYPNFFIYGLILGFMGEGILYLLYKSEKKFGMMAFGIGMFLGFALAIPIVIGALIHHIVMRKIPQNERKGVLIVSGIMGGEGIVGFLSGLLILMGLSVINIALVLTAGLLFILAFYLITHKSTQA